MRSKTVTSSPLLALTDACACGNVSWHCNPPLLAQTSLMSHACAACLIEIALSPLVCNVQRREAQKRQQRPSKLMADESVCCVRQGLHLQRCVCHLAVVDALVQVGMAADEPVLELFLETGALGCSMTVILTQADVKHTLHTSPIAITRARKGMKTMLADERLCIDSKDCMLSCCDLRALIWRGAHRSRHVPASGRSRCHSGVATKQGPRSSSSSSSSTSYRQARYKQRA